MASGSNKSSLFEKVLNGLVKINSLFMVAVFIGVVVSAPVQHSVINPSECDPGANMVVNLLTYEIVSFSFFMLSTLMAESLKIAMYYIITRLPEGDDRTIDQVSPNSAKIWLMVSLIAFVIGGVFILLSLGCLIQIQLGVLVCRHSIAGVATIITVGVPSLLCFVGTIVYTIFVKL